ncbi:unnamed protein product [Lactuca virosa]|uniref:TF-B3 domain-containing protein n=1 Tax=Lactuca virosa TaxID=75947 RepID=A0AAU9LUC0_9ASTR|nr:unnamed protein product [Lactuca virosa]
MATRHQPSFLKILQDPSAASHIALPPDFVRDHMENKIPESSIIRSVTGEHSWNVKIKNIDGIHCFADGWNNVVADSQLGLWDFLRRREEEEEEEEEEEDNNGAGDHGVGSDGDEEDDEDGCGEIRGDDDGVGDPFVKMIISQGHKCCMRVPSEFVRLAGIDVGRSITMRNPAGKEWQMSFRSESKVCTRYYLSSVWSDFWRLNNLSEGDECVFKFLKNEDKLLIETITKKHPAGKVQAAEVVAKKKVQARKVPATVVLTRPVGRPPRVEVEKKKVRAKKPAGKVQADEVREPVGRTPRAEVVWKEVGKRSVGRPRKRKRKSTAGL